MQCRPKIYARHQSSGMHCSVARAAIDSFMVQRNATNDDDDHDEMMILWMNMALWLGKEGRGFGAHNLPNPMASILSILQHTKTEITSSPRISFDRARKGVAYAEPVNAIQYRLISNVPWADKKREKKYSMQSPLTLAFKKKYARRTKITSKIFRIE